MTAKLNFFLSIFYGFIIADNVNAQKYLSVNGTNLYLNGEKVFLSGVNQAWYNYGDDFGNNGYRKSKPHLMNTLNAIQANGGNSIRMWVHIEGGKTPMFNSSGYVTGPGPNMTRDLLDFVREAQRRNILVTLSLWNAAVINPNDRVLNVIQNESILQSYIQNALVPIVRALKNQNAMAIWEIVNEPEGSMQMETENKEEPCYDTSTIHWWDFADWTRRHIPLKQFLRFIGQQANAIHIEDPKALVTVGSWTYRSVTDALDRRAFYSDQCLQYASGGHTKARLDLYQFHTYDIFHIYLPHDPFMIDAGEYKLDKPVIIGEFSQKKGGLLTSQEQFTWAYYHGYNGAWSWSAINSDDASDSLDVQEKGLRSIKDLNDQTHGGRVNITLQSAERHSAVDDSNIKVNNNDKSPDVIGLDKSFSKDSETEVTTAIPTQILDAVSESTKTLDAVSESTKTLDAVSESTKTLDAVSESTKTLDAVSESTKTYMSAYNTNVMRTNSLKIILEFFIRFIGHENELD